MEFKCFRSFAWQYKRWGIPSKLYWTTTTTTTKELKGNWKDSCLIKVLCNGVLKVAVLLLLVTCDTTNLPTEHQVLVQKSYFEEGQQGTEVERWPTPLQNQTYSIILNGLGETKHKDLWYHDKIVNVQSRKGVICLFASIKFSIPLEVQL
jgi:hypothetical protein